MNFNLILRSIYFTILIPGIGIILIPYVILYYSNVFEWPSVSILTAFAFICGLLCMLFLLICIWGFAVYGKGTLALIDPPNQLVVVGLYRYTRNPMYSAIIGILLSEAILFGTINILIYCLIVLAFFLIFVIKYEEPKLRAQFGQSYIEYCQSVPRWSISLKPFYLK
jgi:protein-S-isoprenylcysteine O-methyltransferase Ste14